jgi:AcrR family transcriptional regulator
MLHATPRSRRHAATRERILEAATEWIGAAGPEAITLAGLAGAVDLTPAAIYRYFPNKEAILAEVGATVAAQWAHELAAVADAVSRPDPAVQALARVLAIARAWREGILGDPVRARVIGRVADPSAQLPDDVAIGLVAPALAAIGPLVRALADAPLSPGNPLERAIALLAAQQGVLALHKLGRLTPVIDAGPLAADIPVALLRGWGAPETLLAGALS